MAQIAISKFNISLEEDASRLPIQKLGIVMHVLLLSSFNPRTCMPDIFYRTDNIAITYVLRRSQCVRHIDAKI